MLDIAARAAAHELMKASLSAVGYAKAVNVIRLEGVLRPLVTFGGFTRDVARTVSAFDIEVFPSLWEGTPLTVFEALAMGRPIVATDADGLVDVLTPERDAVIVPKRDAPALAGAIVRLIDDPNLRADLSVRARVTGQQYGITAFVRKMERLYDLLHRVSRPTGRRGVLQSDLSFLTGGA